MIGEKRQDRTGHRGFHRMFSATAIAAAIVTLGAGTLCAQTAKIVSRPLSHQEIHDLGLTNTTQISGGLLTVGVGMPAYLEVEVSMTVGEDVPVVITNVNWALTAKPGGSAATFETSPLDLSVPIYSGIDRQTFNVVSRKMLRPDVANAYQGYVVSAAVQGTANGVPVSMSPSIEITGATFKGVEDCIVCHGPNSFLGLPDKVTPWQGTGHSTMLERGINGEVSSHYKESCIECHSVGFDTTPGANNSGFDDVAASVGWTFPTTLTNTNWDAMHSALQAKSNIQCENCHGPASGHTGGGFGNANKRISVTLGAGDCAQCHDEGPNHTKNIEWNNSPHATAYYRGGSCASCHSSYGFIDSIDGDGKTTPGTGNEGISCAACHDPHAEEGPHQLRPVQSVTLGNGTVVAEGGSGKLCMSCHKGRRNADTYIEDQLGGPSSSFGPHHGPQSDMLVGTNAYAFGQQVAPAAHMTKIDDTCVTCHMQDVADTQFANVQDEAGGHTFTMEADGTDVTLACAECHGELDSFDGGAHDYNEDGVIEGVQTEVDSLLDQLAMLLPPVGTNVVDLEELTTDTDAAAEVQLKAAFNYQFVLEDGSHGIHNPKYAVTLLVGAIEAMGGTVGPAPAKPTSALMIVPRVLTTQEVTDFGLTNTTQTAGGTKNVGVGQPAYLEARVKKGTVVTLLDWNLDSSPDGSATAIEAGPLDLSVPPYDLLDAAAYDVVGRCVVVPDRAGTYTVSALASLPSGVVTGITEVIGANYVGVQGCILCHEDDVAAWSNTRHATFFKRMVNGETGYYKKSCINCHNVGYDTTVGATNNGFDDVATTEEWEFPTTLTSTNWDAMPMDLQHLANIQCENCHGPAGLHRSFGNTEKITVSTSAGNCGQCHDAMPHHFKNNEWKKSPHADAYYRNSGTCLPCHSTYGFIDKHDGDGKATHGTGGEGIACAACHDPHSAGNEHQVRTVADVTLGDGTVITEGGSGKLCMNCHKGRANTASYIASQLGQPEHFGPHHGPQSDLLAGANAFDYGQDLPSSRHMMAVPDTCVHCHMQEVGEEDPGFTMGGGHVFTTSWDGGSNTVQLTEGCKDCHGELEDFDFGGEDYDRDGTVEGVQTEIEGLMHELGMLLPPVGQPEFDEEELTTDTDAAAVSQLKAAFNYLFIEEDRSHGVHNPKYAAALLRASITDLTTGFEDLDGDGMADSWERTHFGNTYAANGQGDADGDGLSNASEAALGTDPEDKDSDDDGFSDLAEVRAGTNPMDRDDKPEAGRSILHPAYEMVTVLGVGTNYQIQGINSLLSVGWTNIGGVVAGNGEELQNFISIRSDTNCFFRVIALP